MPHGLNVCICGIGYVGLTLAAVMAEKGFSVYGVEIKEDVVRSLNHGEPHLHERGLAHLLQSHLGSGLRFGREIPREHFDAYIISVGTPLIPSTKEPDLHYLIRLTEDLSQHITDDSLVILRSTVPIGTSRGTVLPILQKKSSQVMLAFCPERTVEGQALSELTSLPQIVGGLDQRSLNRAIEIFREIAPQIVPVSSLETAEMIKLLDNTYRDLNFAFANQMAEVAALFNVDAWEAIACANQGYARNHIPIPGFVGGACLEKDPHILVDCVNKQGYDASLARDGRAVHESLPISVVARIRQLLEAYGTPHRQAKIFLTGMAFKGEPQTDDLRGAPSLLIIKALRQAGFEEIYVHDFVVSKSSLQILDLQPVTIEEGFRSADAVIVANNHPAYKNLPIRKLLDSAHRPVILYDSWRIYSKEELDIPGVHYEGLGLKRAVRR